MSKLDALIKDFNRQYKEDIAARGIQRIKTNKLNFSSPRINYMLYGGIPRGRLVEFAGAEGSGKTTSALDIAANAQRLFKEEWEQEKEDLKAIEKRTKAQEVELENLKARGPKQIVYADCENTLDEDWARLLGVDVEQMVILKPMSQSAEQIFEMLLHTIETGEVGLVVIDSLGVMLSQQAYDKTMEEKTYGGIAMALTLFSKKAGMLCVKYDCTLIGINQMRADMNSQFGGEDTTGGKGWKHNCSVRLLFRKGNFLDDRGEALKRSAEAPMGNEVLVHVTKTKVCKPDRKVGFYTLMYHTGIDEIADTIETAIRYNLIKQAGSWFNFIDIDTGELISDTEGNTIKLQGKANLNEYLQENKEFYKTMSNKIKELVSAE